MKPLIVANWKMAPATLADAKRLMYVTKRALTAVNTLQVVIAPPAVFLHSIAKGNRSKKISFAAQNMHWKKGGAYTGEISPQQIVDAGGVYVLIGHSERRAAGESNNEIRKKVASALENKLIPILCIGERERTEDGEYLKVLADQISSGIADVPKGRLKDVIIAYEPVWEIGGEQAMKPEEMHGTALYIRKLLAAAHGRIGIGLPILYGGSVNEENAKEMLAEAEIDGLLVGHVSIDARRFAALIESLRTFKRRA